MKTIRLKWKIFAFLLGFCALLLGILWLFETVFLNDMYKYIRSKELTKAIAEAINEVESELEGQELPDVLMDILPDIADRIQEDKDVIIVPTPEFYRIENFEMNAPRGGMNLMPEFISEEIEFELDDGYIIALTFYATIAPVNTTVSTLRIQLHIVTAVMVLLAVIIAFVIAKRVSKPIEDITKNAMILAKGDYGVRFGGKGFHEIVELSDTLNTAAAELGRVEELRRELLANISHDLRTPLTLIYTYAEMMSDFPDEITDTQLKVIMGETRRLSSLVNDVLDISKIENDIESLNKSRFNLTESIRRIIERIQALLENDGYKITFEYGYDVFINADEPKIDRAFYNLLINAVNYAGEDKAVAVRQSVARNRVKISVSDNGGGISKSDLPYVWDRYYKSGKAHKRAVTGTGLGLSIVRRIMELHGAGYGVESEEGKGSCFWFEVGV